jgi:hypothetical protein
MNEENFDQIYVKFTLIYEQAWELEWVIIFLFCLSLAQVSNLGSPFLKEKKNDTKRPLWNLILCKFVQIEIAQNKKSYISEIVSAVVFFFSPNLSKKK